MRSQTQITQTAKLIAETHQTIPYPIGPEPEAQAIAQVVKRLLPDWCVSVARCDSLGFEYQINLEKPSPASKALERPLSTKA